MQTVESLCHKAIEKTTNNEQNQEAGVKKLGSDTVLKVKLISKEIGVERYAEFDNTINQANQFVHGALITALGASPWDFKP